MYPSLLPACSITQLYDSRAQLAQHQCSRTVWTQILTMRNSKIWDPSKSTDSVGEYYRTITELNFYLINESSKPQRFKDHC